MLALDPEQQDRSSKLAALVVWRNAPALVTVAIAKAELDDPVPMSRLRPDGTRLSWQVQFTSTPLFFINWLECPRPSGLPDGGRITALSITTPKPSDLAGVPDIEVREGPWRVEVRVDDSPLV